MASPNWYRLDNIGKFYSAQAGRSSQTTFRLCCNMSEDIDVPSLQSALDEALVRFPLFNTTLRSGLFWHYLEQSHEQVKVQQESLPVCYGLHTDLSSILIRVTYYESRINVEVSHMISDGRGALEFFKTIISNYVRIRYNLEDAQYEYDGTEIQKTEDSYSKNYESTKAQSSKTPKVFRIKGWKEPASPTFFELHMSASEVKVQSSKIGVSVTSLVIAAIIKAIVEVMTHKDLDKTIRINLPVDLRKYFGSVTLKNFFGLVYIEYEVHDMNVPLREIARYVQTQITEITQIDYVKRRMNRMIKLERNPLLRIAPVFLKDMVIGWAERINDRKTTTTASSIGVIKLPETVSEYVNGISVLTSTKSLNFVVCTFKDDLCIGISSIYLRHRIIENFCRIFTSMGISARIDMDKNAKEVDSELKQASFEEGFLRVPRESNRDEM